MLWQIPPGSFTSDSHIANQEGVLMDGMCAHTIILYVRMKSVGQPNDVWFGIDCSVENSHLQKHLCIQAGQETSYRNGGKSLCHEADCGLALHQPSYYRSSSAAPLPVLSNSPLLFLWAKLASKYIHGTDNTDNLNKNRLRSLLFQGYVSAISIDNRGDFGGYSLNTCGCLVG